MIKAILIDLDGVIIHRDGFFSNHLARRQGIELESVLPFFQGEFKECLTGKKNLRDVITPWLVKWQWNGDVNSFLNFWFETESQVDQQILEDITKLRDQNIKVFLATDNEINRINYVLDNLNLRKYFDDIYGSAILGHKKKSPQFWEVALARIPELKPEEILFIDDDPENAEVAAKFGLHTHVFAKGGKLQEVLNAFGSN